MVSIDGNTRNSGRSDRSNQMMVFSECPYNKEVKCPFKGKDECHSCGIGWGQMKNGLGRSR
jgi:hypothetical protein